MIENERGALWYLEDEREERTEIYIQPLLLREQRASSVLIKAEWSQWDSILNQEVFKKILNKWKEDMLCNLKQF